MDKLIYISIEDENNIVKDALIITKGDSKDSINWIYKKVDNVNVKDISFNKIVDDISSVIEGTLESSTIYRVNEIIEQPKESDDLNTETLEKMYFTAISKQHKEIFLNILKQIYEKGYKTGGYWEVLD